MKLSTRTRYGTRAIYEIARRFKQGPTKRKDIVKKQNISRGYLENILSLLRAANIVKAIRGAGGGFELNRDPREISMFEIIEALEGTICPVGCVDNPQACPNQETCVSRPLWRIMYNAEKSALENISLDEFVKMNNKDSIEYAI